MARMPPADWLDSVLSVADETLRTLFAPAHSARPLELPPDTPLTDPERRHIAGLMRVNHAGEVAAQGLYRGHALFSRNERTREFLQRTAREEGDHLAWCEQRLAELGSHPSRLNPLWYLGSLAIGAAAGVFGDEVSLAFVNETEAQVEGHLAGHLERLPAGDGRSRQILEQMKLDEAGHGQAALSQGATELPPPLPQLMRSVARLMTGTAYWI
jgi:ubiquinone biosynthesis monooxygenase Coq7